MIKMMKWKVEIGYPDLSLHSGSSSSKDHLPRSRQASHQEVPKRQQYQDRPPKLQDRPKGPPRKRPPQLWRSRRKPAPRRQIKLVLERQKPLINLVPKINQLVPKWNLVPKSNLVPKRRQTAKLPSPPAPRSKAAASKSLRSPPQPKRHVWGELHSRNTLAPPPPHHPPPGPAPPALQQHHPPPARRKQGRSTFELRGLLSNLFPKRISRPSGEERSSKTQVKPYLGKSLPRPLGRPPRGRDGQRQRRGKLVERLPTGALAQALSL